jgi:DNA-binding MltR family transcriptional regulator
MSKPRKPLTPDALSGSIDDFGKAVNHENDLARVLVVTSYLEQCLAALLRRFFLADSTTADEVFNYQGGFLTELMNRAKLARCLGLISKREMTNLIAVADIRNAFAHTHPELTFDDPAIQEKCKKLHFPKIVGVQANIAGGPVTYVPLDQEAFEASYDTRNRFTAIAAGMAVRILAGAHETKACDDCKHD